MALTRPKYSQIYDTDYKQSVLVATTADVGNLLATGNMTNSIDGVSLTVDDRILVKDQTDTKQNGIYRVSVVGTGVNGTWIRALDADASDKVTSGLSTVVSLGSVNAAKTFRLTTSDPITLGVSPLTFINPYAAGAAAGSNLQIQFNSLGTLGASANLTFNTSSNTLLITGNVTANNVTGNIIGNVTGNLTGNVTGNILTASQPNITTLGGVTSIGASGSTTLTGILQTAAQTNVTSLGTLTSLSTGAITTTGTLALNAAGGLTTNQTTFLLANATATTVNIGGAATTLNIGATTGTLNLNNAITAIAGVSTHAGILYANATTESTTSSNGGLVVLGGVGIAGNVHMQTGKILHVGADLTGSYANSVAQFNSNVNSYSQVLFQNTSFNTGASTDFIAVADTGTDSTNYIDFGINSSTYSDVNYTISGALDGYAYTNGGNFTIGTQTASKNIIFHTGGTLSANKRAAITDAGLTVNTTTASTSITTGALVVNGGAGIAGDVWIGGKLHVANIQSTSTTTLSVTAPLLYLETSSAFPYNYDIGFFSHFIGGTGNIYQHTGFVRNDTDSAWHLISNVAEPAGSQVSLTNAIYDAINTGAHTVKDNPVTAIINGGTSGVSNIGASGAVWNTVFATSLQGTLTTASQPNITSLGTLTSLSTGAITTTGNFINTNSDNTAVIKTQIELRRGSGGGAVATFNTFGDTSNGVALLTANVGASSWAMSPTALQITGNLGIGITPTTAATWVGGSVIPALDIAKGSVYTVASLKSYTTTAGGGGILSLGHSKSATIGTQTATASGDGFGYISFEGVNSSSAVAGGVYIAGTQEGAAGVTYIPGRFQLFTSDGATAPAERLRVDSIGNITVTSTTQSSSPTTGAFTIGGGAGVAKDLHIGGQLHTTNTVASTSTITGAAVINGGLGVAGNINAGGALTAITKSFSITHPTKSDMLLVYGSLESPYHGVRLTGSGTLVKGICTIKLPDYIHGLCKQEGAQVQITNIKHGKVIWVEEINVNNDEFTVKCDIEFTDKKEYSFYWSFTGIRKDVSDLVVEQ